MHKFLYSNMLHIITSFYFISEGKQKLLGKYIALNIGQFNLYMLYVSKNEYLC